MTRRYGCVRCHVVVSFGDDGVCVCVCVPPQCEDAIVSAWKSRLRDGVVHTNSLHALSHAVAMKEARVNCVTAVSVRVRLEAGERIRGCVGRLREWWTSQFGTAWTLRKEEFGSPEQPMFQPLPECGEVSALSEFVGGVVKEEVCKFEEVIRGVGHMREDEVEAACVEGREAGRVCVEDVMKERQWAGSGLCLEWIAQGSQVGVAGMCCPLCVRVCCFIVLLLDCVVQSVQKAVKVVTQLMSSEAFDVQLSEDVISGNIERLNGIVDEMTKGVKALIGLFGFPAEVCVCARWARVCCVVAVGWLVRVCVWGVCVVGVRGAVGIPPQFAIGGVGGDPTDTCGECD